MCVGETIPFWRGWAGGHYSKVMGVGGGKAIPQWWEWGMPDYSRVMGVDGDRLFHGDRSGEADCSTVMGVGGDRGGARLFRSDGSGRG